MQENIPDNSIEQYAPRIPDPLNTKAEAIEMVDNIRLDVPAPGISNSNYASFEDLKNSSFNNMFGKGRNQNSFYNEGFRVSDAYAKLSSGKYTSKFDNFLQGTDNEQRFSKDQTTSNKWLNGLGKFLGKTSTAFVGGTVGTLYGIGESAFTGDWSAVWDNDFQEVMDDWNTQMDHALPNYYTQEEKSKGFFGSLGSANFWANDFLGGLSFTVGAIATEAAWAAATGGTSLATAAARYGLKGARAARVAKNLSVGAKPMKNYLSKFHGTQRAKNYGRAVQTANTLRYMTTSAGYESGVEARHYMNEQRDNFYTNFEELNGRKPTSQETYDFEENLRGTSNAVFTTNLAIVGSSNLAIFGKMFNIKSPLKLPKSNTSKFLFGNGMKVVDGSKQAIKRNLSQRIAGTTYSIFKAPVIEGLYEEGLQAVTSTSAGAFMDASYNPNAKTSGLMEAMYEGFSHTYGTKEGWKEVGLGMLIGAFGGGISSVGTGQSPFTPITEAASKESSIQKNRAKILNSYSSQKLANGIFRANGIQAAIELEDKAEQRGDISGQSAARTMGMMSSIVYGERMDYGSELADEFMTEIDNYSVDEISKSMGVTKEEAKELKENVKEEYNSLRDKYTKNRDFTEYIIGRGNIDKDKEINVEVARDMIAYQMVMASKSEELSRDFVKAVMLEVGDNNVQSSKLKNVIEIEDTLRRAKKEQRQEFNNLKKEHKNKTRELKTLEKQRLTQEKRVNSREDNKSDILVLNKTLLDIAKLQEEMLGVENQLEQSISALTIHTISADAEGFISGAELAQLDTNIKEFEEYLKSTEQRDKPKAARINKYLQEYRKSLDSSKRFGELVDDLMNPETGLKGETRTFLNKLKKHNEPTQRLVDNLIAEREKFAEGQAAMFIDKVDIEDVEKVDEADIIEDLEGEAITEEEYKEFIDTGNVSRSVLESIGLKIKNNKPLSVRENAIFVDKTNEINDILRESEPEKINTIDETIDEIIEKNEYILQNYGENIEDKKPTTKEVDRYEELLSKINPKINPDSFIGSSINTIAKRGLKKIGLNKEELIEFVGLNKRFSDWRIIDGATNKSVSITDLIAQKEALDTPVVAKDLDSMDDSEAVIVALGAKNGTPAYEMSGEMVNTPEVVMVQKRGRKFHLTHIKPKAIVDMGGVLKKNGNVVTDYDDLKKGVHTFDFEEDSVTFSMVGHSRMEFTEEELQKLLDNTGLVIIDTTNIKGSSWSPIYIKEGDNTAAIQDVERRRQEELENPLKNSKLQNDVTGTITIPPKGNKVGDMLSIEVNSFVIPIVVTRVDKDGKVLDAYSSQYFLQNERSDKKSEIIVFRNGNNMALKAIPDRISTNDIQRELETQINIKYDSELESLPEQKGDGGYKPLATDYDITMQGSEYNILDPQALYDMNVGEEIFFKVSLNDSYNAEFESRYIDAVVAYEESSSNENKQKLTDIQNEIFEKVSIYVVNKNNDIVGQLKAALKDVQQTEDFKAIRKYAGNILIEQYDPNNARFDATGVVRTEFTLPYTTKVTSLFAGMPNLNINISDEGVVTPNKKEFTDKTINLINAFGVVEDGNIELNPNTKVDLKGVNKQFVQGLSTATPIVVINYKNQKIAYPINLKETQSTLLSDIEGLINNTSLSDSDVVVELSKLLANNGINPKKYNVRHIDSSNSFLNSKEFDELLTEAEGMTDIISKDEFLSEDFKKQGLVGNGQITINLENNPFQSPKIQVDLKTPIRYNKAAENEEESYFDNTGKVNKSRVEMVANEMVSKSYEQLSPFNRKVLSSHTKEIEKLIGRKIKLSPANKKKSDKERNKKC